MRYLITKIISMQADKTISTINYKPSLSSETTSHSAGKTGKIHATLSAAKTIA